ncbi:MAG: hypothetical protein ACK4V6_19910 [Microthrixaceae bacterium]
MSDIESDPIEYLDGDLPSPEVEMARLGTGVGSAADLAIEDINPANPHLCKNDCWQDHFARLRAEDPVHLNELETSGRYWSLTKYDDVRATDGNWETFSSAGGISLGLRPGPANDELLERVQTFIAMDPPRHTDAVQRDPLDQHRPQPSGRIEPSVCCDPNRSDPLWDKGKRHLTGTGWNERRRLMTRRRTASGTCRDVRFQDRVAARGVRPSGSVGVDSELRPEGASQCSGVAPSLASAGRGVS